MKERKAEGRPYEDRLMDRFGNPATTSVDRQTAAALLVNIAVGEAGKGPAIIDFFSGMLAAPGADRAKETAELAAGSLADIAILTSDDRCRRADSALRQASASPQALVRDAAKGGLADMREKLPNLRSHPLR